MRRANKQSPRVDSQFFAAVNGAALSKLSSLLSEWFPAGHLAGREFECGNLNGQPGKSFKINIETGVWTDFASGEKGGADVVSLYAARHGLKQGEAALRLGRELGLEPPKLRATKQNWQALTPVPPDAPDPTVKFPHWNDAWGKPVAAWLYLDAEGRRINYRVRFETQAGDKDVIPLSWCRNRETGETAWRWMDVPAPRSLYGIEKLATARPDAPILIVQGEKKVDTAEALLPSWVSLSYAGGDKRVAAKYTDWKPLLALAAPKIRIFPDNDASGKHAARAIATMFPANADVKIVEPDLTWPATYDIADLANDGWDGPRLERWIDDHSVKELRRPSITLKPGRLPEIVDDAEKVLVANAEQLKLFQRAGEIVRIISLTREEVSQAKKRDGLERPEGAVVLHSTTSTGLLEMFDRLVAWQVVNDEGKVKAKDCPNKISSAYLSRVGFWKLPHLVGIIEAPMLRPDGTVLTLPGYDRDTGLFLDCAEGWPAIPENPKRPEAETAALDLLAPFDQFPFTTDEDRSTLLAAILTALQRRLLKSAPLFGFSAPSQRSGKSLLVECIGIIATGRIPAAAGVSRENEELRKAITSTLREGHLIAHLDNITHSLDSPDLARAITQGLYSDRLLGSNTTLRLPTNTLWLVTGNNLTFKGDMPSRALLCRIDAKMEHPEERPFKIADLLAHLAANRQRLVTAALTVLRAYRVAGRPKQNVKPWGGFDQWSREIREPLVWLGYADPCKTRERIVVNDPDREVTAEVFRTWQATFGDRGILVREMVSAAQDGTHNELKQSLLMVAANYDDSNQIDARRLGHWCSAVEGRVIDGLRLIREREIDRARTWRLSSMSSMSSKPADQERDGSMPARQESDGAGETVSDRPENNSVNSANSAEPSHASHGGFEDLE